MVGAIFAVQYALNLSGRFSMVAEPLAGLLSFRLRYQGIGVNEYVIVIPLILAAVLFMRLDGRLEPG